MSRNVATFLIPLLLLPAAARCQLVEEYNPPKANCCLANFAKNLADQLQDWNQLGRYHQDNERVKALPAEPRRVVFLGDSITDGWRLAQSFPDKPYVNRGISGQTTPQMLVRMYPDVIDLKPAALIILAGTNDISHNTGPETLTMIEENFQAMTELAQAHGIKVILCSVMPVSDYTKNKQTVSRPPADILKLNAWLREYAARRTPCLRITTQRRSMTRACYARVTRMTGCILTAKGYELVAPVAASAIEKALQ
jgi:hypothetical protein